MHTRSVYTAGLFSLILFVSLTLVLTKYSGIQIDRLISERLQSSIPLWMDPFFSAFSVLGAFELQTAVLLAVLLSFRPGWKKSSFYFGAYFIGTVIELILKMTLPHSGPTKELFRYDLPFFFASSFVQTGHSYPSGHSFRTTFLVMLLLFELQSFKIRPLSKRRLNAFLVLFLLIMLVSRVSLGEHWLTDVIGGGILGVSASFLSWSILHRMKK